MRHQSVEFGLVPVIGGGAELEAGDTPAAVGPPLDRHPRLLQLQLIQLQLAAGQMAQGEHQAGTRYRGGLGAIGRRQRQVVHDDHRPPPVEPGFDARQRHRPAGQFVQPRLNRGAPQIQIGPHRPAQHQITGGQQEVEPHHTAERNPADAHRRPCVFLDLRECQHRPRQESE